MQKILKAFAAIPLNETKFNELCEQILVNSGFVQVSIRIDDLKDSLT